MAEGKKSFLVYTNWKSTFDKLSDEEAGRLIKHMMGYVNDENPEAPDRLTEMVFEPMKAILKDDLKKWEVFVDKQKENGKKGGRPTKDKDFFNDETKETQKTQAFSEKPKKAVNVNVNVNVNENENENEKNTSSSKTDEVEDEFYPFEDFWDDYDKKVGDREKVKKKWDKISKTDRVKIRDYIPHYKSSKPDKQYRKNPETFLNQKSWNDEIIEPFSKKQSGPKQESYSVENLFN